MSEYVGAAGVGWFAIIWSNRDIGAGRFGAGRKVVLGLAETGCLLGVGGRHVTPELTGVEGLFGEGVNEDVVLAGVGTEGLFGEGVNEDVVFAGAGTEGLFGEGVNEDVVFAGVGAGLGAWARGGLSALLRAASASTIAFLLAFSASTIAFLRAASAAAMSARLLFSAAALLLMLLLLLLLLLLELLRTGAGG